MREYGLEGTDFFVDRKKDRENDLIIIRKTGIIKLQQKLGIHITLKEIQTVSYGNKMASVVVVRGGFIGDPVSYIDMDGEANPDNCTTSFNYYVATARKRAESRLTLMLADLTKLDMHGEIEAEEFKASGRGAKALEATEKMAKEKYEKGKE